MNYEVFSCFTIQAILILQVYRDNILASEIMDKDVAFPQESQYVATTWKRENTMIETEQEAILINGPLGGCVVFELENRKPEIYVHEVTWKKGQILMGKMRGQTVIACKESSKRCHIFNNGSLSLCPTNMMDVGQYTAEIFTKDGLHLYTQIIQLELIQTEQEAILINGPLGGCVVFELENRKPEIHVHEVTWKKGQILMGKMRGQTVTACKESSKRCHIFNNGSLSLCPTNMMDVGQYTAEIFTKDGLHLYTQIIQLELIQPKLETEEKPEKTTNHQRLFLLILIGVSALFVLVSASAYHFGKWKCKPALSGTVSLQHSSLIRDQVEYAAIATSKEDQPNRSSALHEPEAEETTAEGQWSLIRNQGEATAAANACTEYIAPLNISTFQGKQKSSSQF